MILAALGVVYGDIGTSPLYALRECFVGPHRVPVTPDNVLGLLSLVLWTLVILVCIKYLGLIMRADNRGEGGVLALMTLVTRGRDAGQRGRRLLIVFGLFGACLLYADAMITPAISVLSAVEGLNVATRFFQPYVVGISLVILTVLFLFQYRGTARIGAVFGPVMFLWFVVISVLGIRAIITEPSVLWAVNPWCAVRFFVNNGWMGFGVLGALFLIMTGAEVLYADMGHFGKRPIRAGWFYLVFPALLLNYFGQGAHLITNPHLTQNLFFQLVPSWALYPMVVLATAATVIASQAVISGAFSLTRQAIQLNYCPRLAIRQTSSAAIGQVYVPVVNWLVLLCTVALILGFRESGKLASAYGVAVATTMLITTLIMYVVARRIWGWSRLVSIPVVGAFLIFNVAFFVSNILKVGAGGWVPLVIGGAFYAVIVTWNKGRLYLKRKLDSFVIPIDMFLDDLRRQKPPRVSGTAVFLTGNSDGTPRTLLHNFKHNKILHDRIILLTIRTEEIPRIAPEERAEIVDLGQGFYRLQLTFGFSESPDLRLAFRQLRTTGFEMDVFDTTFFLGRETLVAAERSTFPGMGWQKFLFAFLSRNALDATKYFNLPANRVVEIGAQIEI